MENKKMEAALAKGLDRRRWEAGKMTLEEYLNLDDQGIDFAVRLYGIATDGADFYIRPQGRNGVTLNFRVSGNELRPIIDGVVSDQMVPNTHIAAYWDYTGEILGLKRGEKGEFSQKQIEDAILELQAKQADLTQALDEIIRLDAELAAWKAKAEAYEAMLERANQLTIDGEYFGLYETEGCVFRDDSGKRVASGETWHEAFKALHPPQEKSDRD